MPSNINDQLTGKRIHEIAGAGIDIYRLYFKGISQRGDAEEAENNKQTPPRLSIGRNSSNFLYEPLRPLRLSV